MRFPLDIWWLTTNPNPRVVDHSEDDGQRGWKRHAVILSTKSLLIPRIQAVCGLRPAHGWGWDLFIDTPCDRCMRRLARMPDCDLDEAWRLYRRDMREVGIDT